MTALLKLDRRLRVRSVVRTLCRPTKPRPAGSEWVPIARAGGANDVDRCDADLRRVPRTSGSCTFRSLRKAGASGSNGSIRADRATRKRPFKRLDSNVSTQVTAVPRIAEGHAGADRQTECRLEGADRAYSQRRRLTATAALLTFTGVGRRTATGRWTKPLAR